MKDAIRVKTEAEFETRDDARSYVRMMKDLILNGVKIKGRVQGDWGGDYRRPTQLNNNTWLAIVEVEQEGWVDSPAT